MLLVYWHFCRKRWQVADSDKKRGFSRHEFSANPRQVGRSPMPLPPPPPKMDPPPRSPARENVQGTQLKINGLHCRHFIVQEVFVLNVLKME
jgi:hypothetical protein